MIKPAQHFYRVYHSFSFTMVCVIDAFITIQVLSKHNSATFLHVDGINMQGVASILQCQPARNQEFLEGVFTLSRKKAAAAFLQAPQNYFNAEPSLKHSHAPQSGIVNQIRRRASSITLAETQPE